MGAYIDTVSCAEVTFDVGFEPTVGVWSRRAGTIWQAQLIWTTTVGGLSVEVSEFPASQNAALEAVLTFTHALPAVVSNFHASSASGIQRNRVLELLLQTGAEGTVFNPGGWAAQPNPSSHRTAFGGR